MSTYKTDQCRLVYRGREFHFVSYAGYPADPAKAVTAAPPMWFLMAAGHRYAVMPETVGEDEATRSKRFGAWLEDHVFDGRIVGAEPIAVRGRKVS